MPDVDILDIMVTLTLGSLDTLKSQLGWCMYHLATHPEDRRRLVADPTLIPGAVEEFLRAYPIVSMARKVTQDVDFHGCPMKKDDMVLLTIQAATRDPRVFPEPEKVHHRPLSPTGTSPSAPASTAASARTSPAPSCSTPSRSGTRAIPDYEMATDEPLMAHGGQVSLLTLPLVWDV